MVKIHDLTGIAELKRREVVEILDDLLTYRDAQGKLSPVIAGYNWYKEIATTDRVITFSHLHETESYKQAMLRI